MFFGKGRVSQQVGCITIFLPSINAICESDENGRFSTKLGLAKLSLEVKFHEMIKLFQGKNYSLFVFLLGASYMQKGSEMKFSSLCRRNLILFDFCGHLLLSNINQ